MDNSHLTFLLFIGEDYYPKGGWQDYQGRFPSLPDARRFLYDMREELYADWYQIADLSKSAIVEEGNAYQRYGPLSQGERKKLKCDACDWPLRPLSTKWSYLPDNCDDDTTWKCTRCSSLYHVERDIATAKVTVERLKE